MYEKVSDEELVLADKLANDIADNIQKYFMESVNPKYTQFCKVEVLVPVTENINMEFMIDVPKEMMDEDNSTLLEYFVNHIYKPEDKYMTESINTIIAERDAAALRLEENLKNFDPEAFLRECEEYESPLSMAIISVGLESGKIGDLPDILEMSIEDDDDKYLTENKEIFGCFPHKAFTKQWYRLGLTASEFKKLKKWLIENYESEDVHPRTGGARKTRWPYKDEGSQGGLRIIHAYISSRSQICALMCYPHTGQYHKNKLTSAEERWIKDEIKILEKKGRD